MSWLDDILPAAAAVAGLITQNNRYQRSKDIAKLGADDNYTPQVGDFSMDAIKNYQQPQAVMPTDSNGYNPSADMGVNLNNPYLMRIMNAKNNYYRAQQMNDEDRMNAEYANAELARKEAKEAGVDLPSFAQAAQNAGYGQSLQNLATLRNAQNAKANGVSYDDFLRGTGQYNFDGNGNGNFSLGNFMKQLADPTEVLRRQNPVLAQNPAIPQNGMQGTAVPNATQPSPMNNPNSFTGVDVNAPNAILNGYNNAKKKTNWLMG